MTKLAVKETIHNARPRVCVQCMTYNHENYIEDALNGFVMQKTDFPFVVAVVDDASTDNNASVIVEYVAKYCDCKSNYTDEEKDYGRVIQAYPLTNSNCLLHIVLLKENHYRKKPKRPYYAEFEDAAKYIAYCEGDDYWIDSSKLQKQVNFMETHPDYAICFHRAKCYIADTGEMVDEYIVRDMPRESSIVDLAQGNYIHYPSLLIRNNNEVLTKYSTLGPSMPGDYARLMLFAETGKIWKFDETMAVYRVGSGIWSTAKSIKNDLQYLCTLNKLYVAIDNDEVRANLQKQIDGIIEFMVYMEKDLHRVQQSKAYRLGKALVKPFKWLKRK